MDLIQDGPNAIIPIEDGLALGAYNFTADQSPARAGADRP